MRFRAELRQSGKTATGIRVPDEIVAALGSKRPPVRVTINGHSYRSTIASMKGEFMLPVSAERTGLPVIRSACSTCESSAIVMPTGPREQRYIGAHLRKV